MSGVILSNRLLNALRRGETPAEQDYDTWFISADYDTPMKLAIYKNRNDVVIKILERIVALWPIDENQSVDIGGIIITGISAAANKAVKAVRDVILQEDRVDLYEALFVSPEISNLVLNEHTPLEAKFLLESATKCLRSALINRPDRIDLNMGPWPMFLSHNMQHTDIYTAWRPHEKVIKRNALIDLTPLMIARMKSTESLSPSTFAGVLILSMPTAEMMLADEELCSRIENYRSDYLKSVFRILTSYCLIHYAKIVLDKLRSMGIEPDLREAFAAMTIYIYGLKTLTPRGLRIALDIFGVNIVGVPRLKSLAGALEFSDNFLYCISTLDNCSELIPHILDAGFRLPPEDVEVFLYWYINHCRDFKTVIIRLIKSYTSEENWTRISASYWRTAIANSRYDLLDLLDLSVVVTDANLRHEISRPNSYLLHFLLERGFADRIYASREHLTREAQDQVTVFMRNRDVARAECAATLDRYLVDDVIRLINDFV